VGEAGGEGEGLEVLTKRGLIDAVPAPNAFTPAFIPDLRPAMPLSKAALIAHLIEQLSEKLTTCEEAIVSTRAAFASDTKSSAGDKHEVGRAMVQQELDKLEEQRAKLLALQQELARVPMDRVYEQVGFGSLVITDRGSYFIAIGLGAVEVDGEACYAISLASPIGQALKDKCVGEVIDFNGKRITVQEIV
jgi:transcription elongation GreA/GreB family factor